MNPPQPGPSSPSWFPLFCVVPVAGTNPSAAAEPPTKLLFVAPKLSGTERSAADAAEEATGEVALSVAHPTRNALAPAAKRILNGLFIVSLQKVTARA
jgi:hypothetical protein